MRFLFLSIFSFFCFSANALQEQPLRELDRTLATYYQNSNPLKVHVTINQPSYSAGDTIFFRATVLSEVDNKPIDKNTILHVMMMNADGEVVKNQKVRLENGSASNQLIVPSSLNPGLYVFVAYHDWMKNSSPEFFFQTYILIHGQLQFTTKEANTLDFFPEGGHLVAGVENRIVVKGPSNTIIAITDGAGQQAATFTTNANGFGSFLITPVAGSTYVATSQNKTFPLPSAEAEGVSMLVKKAESNRAVSISLASLQENLQRVRVVADANGRIYYNSLLKLEQGRLAATIPANDIKQGVLRLSVFGEKGNLLAERLVFISAEQSTPGTLALDGSIFNTRQKVTAKVNLGSEYSGTQLSASIFNKTLYSGTSHPPATASLSLYSNLPGSLTNGLLGFMPASEAWQQSVDMLLISSRKTRASWADIFQKKQPAEKPINIRFTGQIVNEKTGALMTDTTFVTLFLQKNVITYQTFTNKGKFDMPLYIDFFGEDEVYYRIEKRGKPVLDARMEIVEEPALSIQWPIVAESTTADPVTVNARQQKLINNAFTYNQQAQDYKKVAQPHAQIEEEIFGADEVIDLEKYLLFPTMEETIREIIPMVQHRKIKNISTIRVYFSDVNRQSTISPIFIIDGVMTDDVDYFMSLKPTEVSKVKIVNTREKLKTFGAIGRGGVIMVETKITDNFAKVPRSKSSFVVHGLSEPVKVKPFDGGAFKDRIPDLRSSLYWAPEMVIDDNGEATFTFYTSDVTGEYSVKLEGITPLGEPVFIEEKFSVEFKPASN